MIQTDQGSHGITYLLMCRIWLNAFVKSKDVIKKFIRTMPCDT